MQTYEYISGKASWCKTKSPETFGNDSFWSATIHPDAKGLEFARELASKGMKNHIKKDDDGWFIKFKRPTYRKLRSGIKAAMIAPEVIDADNKPFDGLIGNGSDCTFKLEVYDHNTPTGGKAKAARLASIKVHNLVPYDVPSTDEKQKRLVEGLPEQPAPKDAW